MSEKSCNFATKILCSVKQKFEDCSTHFDEKVPNFKKNRIFFKKYLVI